MNETCVDGHLSQKDEGVITLAVIVTVDSEMSQMGAGN